MSRKILLLALMSGLLLIASCGGRTITSVDDNNGNNTNTGGTNTDINLPSNNNGDSNSNNNQNNSNQNPTVQDESFTTTLDQRLTINLKTLISPVDQTKNYSYTITSTPTLGLIQVDNSIVTYIPSNYGTDELKFRVNDGSRNSNIGVIRISVVSSSSSGDSSSGGSSSLTLSNKNIEIMQDEAYQLSLPSIVKNYDAYNTYNFFMITPPTLGSVSITNMTLTYTPKPQVVGEDFFVLRAGDGNATSNDAMISITIQDISTSTPRLQNITYTIAPNDPATLDLMQLLLPPHPFPNRIYQFTILAQGKLGSGSIDGTNLIYTPILNALGTDTSMRVMVTDDLGQKSETAITVIIQP